MKDQHIDILGVSAFLVVTSILSLLIVSSGRESASSYTILAILWSATTSQGCLAYGRRKIEEENRELYHELGEPYSIFNSPYNRTYLKFMWYVVSLGFLKLEDRKTKLSFIGFLTFSVIAIASIFHLQQLKI